MTRQQGYTLVELVVVMAIFLMVMGVTTMIFNSLLKTSAKTSKSAETQITDIIGLEVMRADIKHAGHGLPYVFPTPVQYNEAPNTNITVDPRAPAVTVNPSSYNDGKGAGINADPPRPFWLDKNAGVNGSAYLVVKSTMLGTGSAAQRWNYVTSGGALKLWDEPERNFVTGDNAVVIFPAPNSPPQQQRQLVTAGGSFYAAYQTGGVTDLANFNPTDPNDTFTIFGISDPGETPRMPFNRADYFIQIPADSSLSQRCAPGTGILYKAILHQDGTYEQIPLMDCVGDMQVAFGLTGLATNKSITTYDDANTINALSEYDLTSQVKEVRLYILTHEGNMDSNYRFPAGTINVGENLLGTQRGNMWIADGSTANFRMGRFGTDWQHYHWKVLKVVIIPSSL